MENLILELMTQIYNKPVYLKTGEDESLFLKTNIPKNCEGTKFTIIGNTVELIFDPVLLSEYPDAIMYIDNQQLDSLKTTITITENDLHRIVILWSRTDNVIEVFSYDQKEDVIFDYYVGWVNMSRNNFFSTNENTLKTLMSGYNIEEMPTYYQEFGQNSLVFLVYNENSTPKEILFTSGGQIMSQNLLTDNTAEHEDIIINEKTYHVWGISHPGFAEFDPTDNIKIIFR